MAAVDMYDFSSVGRKVYTAVFNSFVRRLRADLSARIRTSHQISVCPATLRFIGADKPMVVALRVIDHDYIYKTIMELEQERYDSANATIPRNL